MSANVLIEVDAKHEAMLRRALALAEELEQLALTAPDGTVFDACETAVIDKGPDLQRQLLSQAVARRIEAAEKKGRRPASAPADARRRTVGRNNAGGGAPPARLPSRAATGNAPAARTARMRPTNGWASPARGTPRPFRSPVAAWRPRRRSPRPGN
jgi:hypothetical protein